MAVPLSGRPASRHLIVLAKAPRLGQAKRRLAASIGPVAAWSWYRRVLARTLRLARDPRWQAWLAVTPDAASGRWQPRGIRRIGQGRGDLGRRMDRALRRPPPGAAVLVGADIPGMPAAHLAAAFRALGSRPYVLGPAADGGYWLVGARRRPAFPYAFADVRWSTEHALADTLRNLPRGAAALVARLHDVDRAEDLEALGLR